MTEPIYKDYWDGQCSACPASLYSHCSGGGRLIGERGCGFLGCEGRCRKIVGFKKSSAEWEKQIADLQNQLTQKQNQIDNLTNQLNAEKAAHKVDENKVAELNKKIEELNKEIEKLKKDKQKIIDDYAKLEAKRKAEYDVKYNEVEKQRLQNEKDKKEIEASKISCLKEKDIFSLPRNKRMGYLNDKTCSQSCTISGYDSREKKLHNIPECMKLMNPTFFKTLGEESCKIGGSEINQQCEKEEDCKFWGYGNNGKGNTCNLETKKCIGFAKGGTMKNKVYECNMDGWFSKLSYKHDVDPEKICRLNGYVSGISNNHFGTFNNYEELCRPQNNQKGITQNGLLKSVDKNNLVSWKCLGEKQKPAVALFDIDKVPTSLNDKSIKKWELYVGTYKQEEARSLGINLASIKSMKIHQNCKVIVFSSKGTSKNFTTLFEGSYHKTDLQNQNIHKIDKLVVMNIDSDIKKKCSSIGGIIAYGDSKFVNQRFEVKLVGGKYDLKLLQQKGIKGPILSMKVGYGYEVRMYKEKTFKDIQGKKGFYLPQGEYSGVKDKLSNILDELKRQSNLVKKGTGKKDIEDSNLDQTFGYINVIKLPSPKVGVIIYELNKFMGAEYYLETGKYTSEDLKIEGVIPGRCSGSIKVLKGFKVNIFQQDNFKGKKIELEEGIYEFKDLIDKDIKRPILSIVIYKKSAFEYHCVPGVPYPVRLNDKNYDKIDCPLDENGELINVCNIKNKGCLGGNDLNYMVNKFQTFKCDDEKIKSKDKKTPVSACFYLKQKKPLVFSKYGKHDKNSLIDQTNLENKDTLDKKKEKYYGNHIEVLMDKEMCRKLSGDEGLSSTVQYNYTKCKLNLSELKESNGKSLYLSGLNEQKKSICNNDHYAILKSNKVTCDNMGGLLLNNKGEGDKISIYDQILLEVSKKDNYFKDKLMYSQLTLMDKALFHSKYFPNFEAEEPLGDKNLEFCKVPICENGNLQLRKQEDCLPNHKKGKAIIYAKRKQCDKLNGKIKDKLIKGSSVDNNKYYPCEFEVCNREYK